MLSMRPKGDAKELEMRRKIAARMLSQGKSVREVAEAGGKRPLRREGWPPSHILLRSPKLSTEQKKELEEILLRGARAALFSNGALDFAEGGQDH
jgi:transposase